MPRSVMATLLAALWCCSDGPNVPVDGIWHIGPRSGSRFSDIYLVLQQEGGLVSGTSCAVSSGHVLWRTPVRGHYPRFGYLVTQGSIVECLSCVGNGFNGEITSHGRIVGVFYRGDEIIDQATEFVRSSSVERGCE